MRPFLNFPAVEKEIEAEIEKETQSMMLSQAHNGNRPPLDVLTDYLGTGKRKERLKMIVGMSGSSREKLCRIFEAIYPDGSFRTFLNDEQKRRRIASFLLYPDKEQTFIPDFIRKSFRLPKNWIDLLRDKEYMLSIVRNAKASKCAVRMGFGLEDEIVRIVDSLGITHAKGKVDMVDGKEVDVAIPNKEDAYMLVMSSYALTTSSSQTTRANEQTAMYQKITEMRQSRRGRNKRKCLFVNVVDGGGWLARVSDLEQLWLNCDYCFPYSGLNHFKTILQQEIRKQP